MAGILHTNEDRNSIATPTAKDLAPLFARQFTRGALVPPQVIDIQGRVFIRKRQSHPLGRVAVDISTIGNESDNTTLTDAVRCPPQGANIGIVECPLASRRRPPRIRLLNPPVQRRILDVRIQVVRAALPHRVRRIPDDHADRRRQLSQDPSVVVREHDRVHRVPGFGNLERVGQRHPGERLIGVSVGGLARQSMVGRLDVHRGDVVRQQHDLVGVQLLRVLSGEVGGRDQVGLQQPGNEGARPRKTVQNMHALIGQPAPEMLARHEISRPHNEVHDLDRRVHDPQRLGLLLEADPEELLVQLGDHLLLALGAGDLAGAPSHRFVKAFQPSGFGLQAGTADGVDHLLHGP